VLGAMRILILGGTSWLGGMVASTAVDRGHSVTCLARGAAGDPPAGVTFVHADRDRADAYAAVVGQQWDAVVDVARQPGQVRRAATALADRAGLYIFVSSCSVYADHSVPDADEHAALLPALVGDVMESMETYGEAKVACEQHVLAAFGADRCLIARSTLIGGPGDPSDRTGYWPMRFHHPASADGAVLIPDAPDVTAQVIDVRDLAAWLVDMAERAVAGTYNVGGEMIPLPEYLGLARAAAGHTGPVVPADPRWLVAEGVETYMGERSLPHWLPMPSFAGWATRNRDAALATGLTTRPAVETLRDTLAWELTLDPERPRKAGLTPAEERALLALLPAPV